MKNINDIEIDNIKKNKEYPPYKCKMCGEWTIENLQEICPVCGWQDCDILYQYPDCFGGPSILSFNQYKQVWENNKKVISNKRFGKYGLIKQIFEENLSTYGGYSKEQLDVINKYKRMDKVMTEVKCEKK